MEISEGIELANSVFAKCTQSQLLLGASNSFAYHAPISTGLSPSNTLGDY